MICATCRRAADDLAVARLQILPVEDALVRLRRWVNARRVSDGLHALCKGCPCQHRTDRKVM